jgi:preprotein translocase YajC subunit
MSSVAAQVGSFLLSGTASSGGFNYTTIIFLVLIFVVMYFLMIRPQRKREKAVTSMRDSLKIGDKVVTIGGIRGEIIKTRDDVLTIQVGADKVKFEVMRWAISKVDEAGSGKSAGTKSAGGAKETASEEENKPVKKPRRLTPKSAGTTEETEESAEEAKTDSEKQAETSMKDREAQLQAKVEKGNTDGE